MKNRVCVAILFAILVAVFSPAALAQDQPENRTIDVIGTGRIRGGDISGARDQAISDCRITAISLVAADLLQQQVLVQSFQDINRLLFVKADNFIQDYKVLTEDTTGRIYRVMVQATVSVEKIRDILFQNDILSQNATPLKVLLLIAEQDLDSLFYTYWWGDSYAETVSELPLAGTLIEQGFTVLDHNPSPSAADDLNTLTETPLGPEMNSTLTTDTADRDGRGIDNSRPWPAADNSDTLLETPLGTDISETQASDVVDREFITLDRNPSWPVDDISEPLLEAPLGPEMSNDQAAALGTRFQADVVIVGTASVRKASNVLGDELRSYEGTLSVRAIRTDTGAVLSEINHNFITADADDLTGSHRALTEASAQTGVLLAGEITAAWQQTVEKGPISATIVVEGNYQLSHLVAFRRTLSEMPGGSGLQTRGMTPDETTLSIDYDGTIQELAEALLLNSFKGFGVHITEASSDTIRLSLVSD